MLWDSLFKFTIYIPHFPEIRFIPSRCGFSHPILFVILRRNNMCHPTERADSSGKNTVPVLFVVPVAPLHEGQVLLDAGWLDVCCWVQGRARVLLLFCKSKDDMFTFQSDGGTFMAMKMLSNAHPCLKWGYRVWFLEIMKDSRPFINYSKKQDLLY